MNSPTSNIADLCRFEHILILELVSLDDEAIHVPPLASHELSPELSIQAEDVAPRRKALLVHLKVASQVAQHGYTQFGQLRLYFPVQHFLQGLPCPLCDLIEQAEVVDEAYYLLNASFESVLFRQRHCCGLLGNLTFNVLRGESRDGESSTIGRQILFVP